LPKCCVTGSLLAQRCLGHCLVRTNALRRGRASVTSNTGHAALVMIGLVRLGGTGMTGCQSVGLKRSGCAESGNPASRPTTVGFASRPEVWLRFASCLFRVACRWQTATSHGRTRGRNASRRSMAIALPRKRFWRFETSRAHRGDGEFGASADSSAAIHHAMLRKGQVLSGVAARSRFHGPVMF
jgi:hypothetical protein